MSTEEWQLRRYCDGDETGIAALFGRGFGQVRDPASWRWKYRARGKAQVQVWLAVDHDHEPIFHYGAVPRSLDGPEGHRPALVAFDAVADPRFRRRGVFSAVMEEAHSTWRDSGFSCILGLPNEQWGSRVDAFDWRALFPLRWQIRLLRPETLLAQKTGLSALRGLKFLGWLACSSWPGGRDPALETTSDRPRPEDIQELWKSCRRDGKTGLERNRGWLDDRFVSCPDHDYRFLTATRHGSLAGYLVYRFDASTLYGFIAEILTRPSDRATRKFLLRACVDRLREEGATAIASLAVPGTELSTSLRKAGFLFSWGSFTVRCVPLDPDLSIDELRSARNWWLCGGDFDVI